MSPVIEPAKPWETPWPLDGIENIGKCPICGELGRGALYKGLVDNTFFCAAGKWTLWSCETCGAAYLDPRPSVETIHLAYEQYYTHGRKKTGRDDYKDLSYFRKIRRRLVNGYTNWRFGTNEKNANALGVVSAFLIPGMRTLIDSQYRSLPMAPKKDASLLDLGCGDGAFLEIGMRCGWSVVGIDPDPKAIEVARQRGFEVNLGGIEVFEGKTDLFDYITMCHVIEHLHDPSETLEACFKLLRPGGMLWIETPNIDSSGRKIFGENWRGLESPRHLVIQSSNSLSFSLKKSGFSMINWSRDRNVYRGMFMRSSAISQGRFPEDTKPLSFLLEWQAFYARILGALLPRRREFLIVTAKKIIA